MIDETVVIGTGPYGLSVAVHLRDRGAPVRIFGQPMSTWHNNMPAGMILKSTSAATSISGPKAGSLLADYLAECGHARLDSERDLVPIELFIDYGSWFAGRNVPDVEEQHVTRISRAGAAFTVTLADGEELRTRSVVVATGHVAHRYIPPELTRCLPGESAFGLLSHASEHSDLSRFSGQRLAVVGGGQSALESAALLHEAGADVVVLVRESRVRWGSAPERSPRSTARRLLKPTSALGRGWSNRLLADAPQYVSRLPTNERLKLVECVLGPSGGWWLRDRVEGRVETRLGTSVARCEAGDDGGVTLELVDATAAIRHLTVDHVISATGYRVDIGNLDVLDTRLVASINRYAGDGSPALDSSFESSVPGLFFTGLAAAATFGPVLRFVCGTEFAGPRIGTALSGRK